MLTITCNHLCYLYFAECSNIILEMHHDSHLLYTCFLDNAKHDSGSHETLVEVSMHKYSAILTINMACAP